VVHEYAVGSVWIFEGIRHGNPHFDRYASLPSPHSRRSGRVSAPSALRANQLSTGDAGPGQAAIGKVQRLSRPATVRA
jgi:hypothetical protein